MLAIGGWLVAIAVALITAIVQWRKGSVDETAIVMVEWKKLIDAHQHQIEMMQTRINALTQENTDLRARLTAAEKRLREQDDEIAGLKRAIIQNSQSAAIALHKKLDDASPDSASE